GLFGSFAAYVGSLFVADEGERESRQHRADREMVRHLNRQVALLTEEVRALRAEMVRQQHVQKEDTASASEARNDAADER
ncbi:ion transporter, partial [Halomonas sp. BBD48]|nr:ion transporter [Halomonas sp. BBD48]